MGEEIKTEE